VEGQINF